MNQDLKIFIVEDHPIVLEGLKIVLGKEDGIEVCGDASDTNTAINIIKKIRPDIVITDLSLKGSSSGIDLTARLSEEFPDIKVLVLSMLDETFYAERAIKAGARGYLMKDTMLVNVVEALRDIARGEIYVSENMRSYFISGFVNKNSEKNSQRSLKDLTNRELEVLKLIGRGYNSAKIARLMQISDKTVDTYKQRIKEKLSIKTGNDLLKFAIDEVNREERFS